MGTSVYFDDLTAIESNFTPCLCLRNGISFISFKKKMDKIYLQVLCTENRLMHKGREINFDRPVSRIEIFRQENKNAGETEELHINRR